MYECHAVKTKRGTVREQTNFAQIVKLLDMGPMIQNVHL